MKPSKLKLIVNASQGVQVNVRTRVNSASIRREVYNGRDHIVMPSYTLPSGVIMNRGLYPAGEIDAHYKELEGTLAPLGHPTVDGKFVSAFSPEGINVGHIGAWNRNVKKSGNRVYLEKWLDVEVAGQTEGGRRLIERVEALARGEDVPPIHTSVAVFLTQEPAPEGEKAYDWVAKIEGVDHDAILLDEVGAATPEQGVGLMVNADDARPVANSGALEGESYGDKMNRLSTAVSESFAPGPDDYAYVADFTDTQVVVIRNGGAATLYGYSIEAGKVTFESQGTPVQRRESWVLRLNRFLFGNGGRPDPGEHTKEKSDMDEKERAEFREALTNDVKGLIQPLADQVTAIQANQTALTERLTANERAAEADKRAAVEAKFGKVVADGLTGNALDEMFKQCGTAASLAGNSGEPTTETGAPDPAKYFGGAQ